MAPALLTPPGPGHQEEHLITDPTLSPRLGDIARARRLYVTERPEGRCDVFEATVDVPATTADLCLVGTFIADALDGLGLVATSTAGVFLAVLRDDMTSDAAERIADAALRADPPETVADLPIELRPDPDPVGALAQAHVADLRDRIAQLAHTVALLPASRRRAAARAAVTEVDRSTADVLRSLGIDDSTV